MREAFARVRHFMSGERVESRLGAEARERRLRGRREALELGQQAAVHLFAQRVERMTKRGGIATVERILQRRNLRAKAFGIRRQR